jgi:glycosyltransferase involved in cell wall biosynthesis
MVVEVVSMKDDLISVIIPVYNVDKYIDRCLESIVSQTYSNLEIIVVDDGSTDESLSICDKWMNRDGRIKVIHKKNGGVSSARNVGLEISRGAYIVFVDPDDYIETSMIEIMYKKSMDYCADLVCCGINYVSLEGMVEYVGFNEVLLEKDDAIKSLLSHKGCMRPYVWDKLYKREIIEDKRFDNSLKHAEDILFVYEVLKVAETVMIISDALYYYVKRKESLVGSKFKHSQKQVLEAAQIIINNTDEIGKYRDYAIQNYIYQLFCLLNFMILSVSLIDNYDDYIDLKQKTAEFSYVYIYRKFGIKFLVKWILCIFSPALYRKIV